MAAVTRRSLIILTALALPALIGLVGLGVWQVQRLQWKEALVAHIEARRMAAPVPLQDGLVQAERGFDINYLGVSGAATRMPGGDLKFYWIDNGQPGWRLYSPYELSDGTQLIVDRGFVTDAVLQGGELAATPPLLRGRLRSAEKQATFTPDNDAPGNVWYWRDINAMADALGMNKDRLAPVYLVLEGDAPWPKASALPPELSNRHLGYAITWFGLAACLVGVYGVFVVGNLRSFG